MNYAIVKDDTIINLVRGELAAIKALYPTNYVVNDNYQLGWVKQSDGTYAAPPTFPGATFIQLVIKTIDGEARANTARFEISKDSTTDFVFEMQDETGDVRLKDEHFTLPIVGLLGQSSRTVGIDFVQGVGSVSIGWPTSGEWQMTEEAINITIDNGVLRYVFSDLNLSVYE